MEKINDFQLSFYMTITTMNSINQETKIIFNLMTRNSQMYEIIVENPIPIEYMMCL